MLAAALALPAAGAAAATPTPPQSRRRPRPLRTRPGLFGTVTNLVFSTNQAGQLIASGTFLDTLGNPTNFVTTVTQATGSCQILDLTLGSLDLNLLGLMVHLDTVHLNITAQQGPGNLLGNLLCAVAGLLDNNGSTNGLAALLNRLVAGL
jgi:hypothetical protein